MSSTQGTSTTKEKGKNKRRSWTIKEEEALICVLKQVITSGLKSDNGFKTGYLTVLENYMKNAFPGTDLKGMPHIHSKIHVWKKNHGSLATMMSRSGFGWNETYKMIDVTDDVWDSYVKTDLNAKGMRGKKWPMYHDWFEIFGNDRATGERAAGLVDAMDALFKDVPNSTNENDTGFSDYFPTFADEDEYTSVHQMQESNGRTEDPNGKTAESNGRTIDPNVNDKKFTKKRKSNETSQVNGLLDAMNNFTEKTEKPLGEIAKRIGFEFDMSKSRKEVFEGLGNVPGLTNRERLVVATHLVKSKEELELFFSLPDFNRSEMAHMLKGDYP